HTHTHTQTDRHTDTHLKTHRHKHSQTHIHTLTHTHTHTHTLTFSPTHTHTNTYAHGHTPLVIHMETQTVCERGPQRLDVSQIMTDEFPSPRPIIRKMTSPWLHQSKGKQVSTPQLHS